MSPAIPARLSRDIESRAERRGQFARGGRAVIRKRGWLAALLTPIGIACGIVIVCVPAIAIWSIHTASEARRVAHETPVATTTTVVDTNVERRVGDGETEFVLRLTDGKLVRVIARRDATSDFLNDTLVGLDAARTAAHERASAGLDEVFTRAFATRQADIDAYADWFFEWGRSWRFLYEAVAGAVQEAVRLSFSQTQVSDAARHAVEDYLLRHYQDMVLKPGLRDPVIVAGVREVLDRAHEDYLRAIAALDDRMQRFLSEEIASAEALPGSALTMKIDWDAEKWRAPRWASEDRYLEPVGTAVLVGGGAIVGSVLQRVALPFFARATAQVMTTAEMTIGGAAVGSVQPGLGTAIGALAGLALDWGLSKFTEYLERDDFVADNAAALDATIVAWKAQIMPEIERAIDVWFDDTRATVGAQASAIR